MHKINEMIPQIAKNIKLQIDSFLIKSLVLLFSSVISFISDASTESCAVSADIVTKGVDFVDFMPDTFFF